jgi:hypothetical protein
MRIKDFKVREVEGVSNKEAEVVKEEEEMNNQEVEEDYVHKQQEKIRDNLNMMVKDLQGLNLEGIEVEDSETKTINHHYY